jgi:hypothetical protein
MPLISFSMDKGGVALKQAASKASAKIKTLEEETKRIIEMTAISQEAPDRKEDVEAIVFAESLRDMRYHHLHYPMLKRAFKTSIEMALTHGQNIVKDRKDTELSAVNLLTSAQCEVARVLTYIGDKGFSVRAEEIFNGISEKYKESKEKKEKTELETHACEPLSYMLERYNELTGTGLRDMRAGHEPIAVHMLKKVADIRQFSSSTIAQVPTK